MTKHVEAQVFAEQDPDENICRVNAHLSRGNERLTVELGAAKAEMDNLAHTISHDLRSPLTVIGGFADLLTKHFGKDLDKRGLHYLDLIKSSTAQAGRMLDEILSLSRMGLAEMHFVPVDSGALVDRVVKDLDATKGDRRVAWAIGNLPTINADPTLLRQAITSLLFNALKFTRSCEFARIQVGVQDGDHEMIFFVRDNGEGLDLKIRKRMFSAFQGTQSPPEKESSTIGWSYVQRIIQRHGGRMWMEAASDGGAIFFFSIPDGGPEPELRSGSA
jgi:light-regulated signal transduction histidine kinase (bacteriophytochrome)